MNCSNGRLVSPGCVQTLIKLTCSGRSIAKMSVDIPSILHIYISPVNAIKWIIADVDISSAIKVEYQFRRSMECG